MFHAHRICKPNLEMQTGHRLELPKRSRYYQAAADDLTLLDPELKLFYDYIRRGTADSTLTEKINSSITELKEDRETRRKYMTYTTRMAEAKSEAREEGIKYGISIGLSQGVQQAKLETAKNLLSIGLSQDQIASVTGLSVEEIEKL